MIFALARAVSLAAPAGAATTPAPPACQCAPAWVAEAQ